MISIAAVVLVGIVLIVIFVDPPCGPGRPRSTRGRRPLQPLRGIGRCRPGSPTGARGFVHERPGSQGEIVGRAACNLLVHHDQQIEGPLLRITQRAILGVEQVRPKYHHEVGWTGQREPQVRHSDLTEVLPLRGQRLTQQAEPPVSVQYAPPRSPWW